MRKRHLSSYTKLSVIIFSFFLTTAIFAKIKNQETNIVCFAAQSKWVCAPEDKQEIANIKAEVIPTNIVIKPINIPKFQTSEKSLSRKPDQKQIVSNKITNKPTVAFNEKTRVNDNPYAKLWAHQLIGVSTPNSAINFVKNKNINKEDVLIIKSVRKEMDWWIILYGLYKDKQTGLDNESNLPKNIKKPWLRPLKNLTVNGFIEDF